MKCSESTLQYIQREIRRACEAFKGRSAGSEAERACQAHFAKELNGWSDEVRTEPFRLHPEAFLGWIIPTSALAIAAAALVWVQLLTGARWAALLGFACATLALLPCLGEFILYRQWFDFAFPAKESANVYARRKPSGEIKRRIIFGGHADAAYEMAYVLHPDKRMIFRVIGGALGGVLCMWCSSLAFFLQSFSGPMQPSGVWLFMGVLAILGIPALLAGFFFINKKQVVDGANDNLSGCLVAMGVLREMARQGVRLQNTEVCCLITGGEESGLRGAMAFVKAHKEELKAVDTVFIALETLRETGQLMVYPLGMNGTQKNSRRATALLQKAGRRLGFPLREAGLYPGATDAEAFSREGLTACGLCGVDHAPQPYYHTRYDTFDNISPECLRRSLDLCLETAALFDGQAEAATPKDAPIPAARALGERAS